jgi:hypothetical protein
MQRIIDRSFVQRLERAEATSNASFVDARQLMTPDAHAGWQDINGTYALFDAVGSPLTQSFGLGLFCEPTDAHLAELDGFFTSRGAVPAHEVSSHADMSVLSVLQARGFRAAEMSSVLYKPINPLLLAAPDGSSAVHAVITPAEQRDAWATTVVGGWSEYPEFTDVLRDLSTVMAAGTGSTCFHAVIDGEMAATGLIACHNGVALLAGASTLPAYRGRGAQNALLHARLAYAVANNCDIAMVVAQPGSTSQRNAERNGFRLAYTRTKWVGAEPV